MVKKEVKGCDSMEQREETIIKLLKRLPHNYKQEQGSNNYFLLKLLSGEFDQSNTMLAELKKALLIDQSSGANLDRIGQNIQQRRGHLEDSIYRVLLKARMKLNRSNCTINEIIEILATIFGVEKEGIKVQEPEWGSFKFSSHKDKLERDCFGFDLGRLASNYQDCASIMLAIPTEALNSIGFSRQWFEELMREVSAAGVRANLLYQGSFAFAPQSNQAQYNSKQGFDQGSLGAYFEAVDYKRLPLEN